MPIPPRFPARYPLLDSWRGFACVIVVLHHAGFAVTPHESVGHSWAATLRTIAITLYRRCELGVPLFFVISGYCIAASMDAHRRKGASSWRFLGRRIWRIYPPYWVAVAGFVVVVVALRGVGWKPIMTGYHSLHLDAPGEFAWSQWLGNLTLTETWRPRLFGAPYKNLTRISWTLCFEEQFYLISFLLLLTFPRRLFGAIAVTTGLIFAWCLVAFDAGWFYRLEGIFPELWYEFAVGLAVYWRLVVAETPTARRAVDFGLGALGVVGLIRGSLAMMMVAAFGLALIALRPSDALVGTWRALAPFRACGLRCYSIYLIHLPVCTVGTEALIQLGLTGFWTRVFLVAPVVALAGVGAGWLFYALVESRFYHPAPSRPSTPGPFGTPGVPPDPDPSRAAAQPDPLVTL